MISAMATEIFFSNLGKIHRLSLLDPGTEVSVFKVKGEYAPVEGQQIGFVNKVKVIDEKIKFIFLSFGAKYFAELC